MKNPELSHAHAAAPDFIDYFIDSGNFLNIAQEPLRERNCVFCNIAHGEDPSTDLLYKDDNYVAFRSIRPAASHHYLIIPKSHIKDAVGLGAQHVPMLDEMEAIANDVLTQLGGDSRTARIGYHWPPFISVSHLHLHAIAPADDLSIKASILFQPGSKWFRTTQEVVSRIKARAVKPSL
ncbi:hypothetical protein JTE90_000735 [Oedothorax gibbosus]|uniref:Adenosine 5'-monophosphoramidase HINT3 n=1 Tax=Oedothorax gibbosus TaxID=931172 RepID=A0AAV6UMW2_9ARAC|nr:hypothetical protein JTE90_000735 [Oedothorax gibbosus]